MRLNKRHGAVSSLMLSFFLAACGASQPPVTDEFQDIHFVQVTFAGNAQCLATSESANAASAEVTNIMRSRVGFAPVKPNAVLARAAARHACDMARTGRMSHVSTTTTGPAARVKEHGYIPLVTAENIAAGHFSREAVLQEWNKSPDHLANILIPQIREFGIGQAIAADGKTRFWAAVYSVPR